MHTRPMEKLNRTNMTKKIPKKTKADRLRRHDPKSGGVSNLETAKVVKQKKPQIYRVN